MARPRQTGLNTVTRKLPDGTTTRTYYHARTRTPLGTDRNVALARAAELDGAPPPGPSASTFEGLCVSYLSSSRFLALKPRSRALNRFYIERLRDVFGSLPAVSITRPVVVRFREAEAGRPWYATHLLAKLRLVLQHGVDTGVLKTNPALRPGGVKPPPRHAVWSREQTDALLAAAPPDIRLACALLLYTAQRPSDVLAMTWRQVERREGRTWLTLRQQKTSELVTVPAHRDLAELLINAERRAVMLVPSPTGRRWLYRNFSRAWDRAVKAAGIEGVQRRDLRRTAMVRMAEAGASTPQIAAVSGHTIDQTARILDTYIPRRGEVAAGAIEAWEQGQARGVVVPIRGVEEFRVDQHASDRKR